MDSTRNIVIVALMQLGVIIFAVLGCHDAPARLWGLLPGYRTIAVLIPLVWAACVVILKGRDTFGSSATIAFWFGVLMLIGLLVFVAYSMFGSLITGDSISDGGTPSRSFHDYRSRHCPCFACTWSPTESDIFVL